jgi:hypothetical protein
MSGEFWDYARILISPADPMARALTALDWAVKMIYVLRYLDEKAQPLTRCSTRRCDARAEITPGFISRAPRPDRSCSHDLAGIVAILPR